MAADIIPAEEVELENMFARYSQLYTALTGVRADIITAVDLMPVLNVGRMTLTT